MYIVSYISITHTFQGTIMIMLLRIFLQMIYFLYICDNHFVLLATIESVVVACPSEIPLGVADH